VSTIKPDPAEQLKLVKDCLDELKMDSEAKLDDALKSVSSALKNPSHVHQSELIFSGRYICARVVSKKRLNTYLGKAEEVLKEMMKRGE